MSLLELPLSLVTDIIALVVLTGKIEEVLRLREVNGKRTTLHVFSIIADVISRYLQCRSHQVHV